MKKSLESLESKKFNTSLLKITKAGETTYGNKYSTRHDGYGGQDGDVARTTYNPAGYPPGTQGQDYVYMPSF